MKSFLKSKWPLFLLIGLVALFLADVCFGGKMLFLRDLFNGDLWSRVIVGQAIRAGKFPLWYSLSGGGFPFAANPYMGACYPFNWIFVLPNMELAIRLWWVFHLSVAAISFYLLARHWRLAVAPALFAAVSFAFSTFVVAWMEFAQAITCLVWGPLALLLTSLIIEGNAGAAAKIPIPLSIWKNRGLIAGLAAVIALQILASGEFFYYTTLFTGTYAVCKWAALKNWNCCGRSMLQISLAGALGVALAMPHLLPVMELLPFTDRVGEVDALTKIDSAHSRHWLSFILPFLYGRPGYPQTYWAANIYEFAFGTCYAGVLPLLGIAFGLSFFVRKNQYRDRRFLVWFFAGVGLFSLLMAMGENTSLYGLVHHTVPGFGHFRYPTKFLLFVTYSMAMLGALGFQAVLDCDAVEERRLQQRVLMGCLVFGGLLLVSGLAAVGSDAVAISFMGHAGQPTPTQFASTRHDFLLALLFSALGIALFGSLVFKKMPSRQVQVGVIAVAFVNLWIVSRQVQPTLTGGFYNPRPALKQLEANVQYRAWTPYSSVAQYLYGEKRLDILEWARRSGGITADWPLHEIRGTSPVGFGLSRFGMLAGALGQVQPAIGEKIADLLSVRQVISGEPFDKVLWADASREFQVTKRANPLPRAFVTSQWRIAPDGDTAMRTLLSDGFDPHREAVLEPLPDEPSPEPPGAGRGEVVAVSSIEDHHESLMIEAKVAERSLLVLGDNWFPGWGATVDGVRKPIFRANYAFRGVFLDPGTHHVEFTYKPGSFRAGLVIASFSAVFCLWMGVGSFRERQPAGDTPSPEPEQAAPAPRPAIAGKPRNATKRKKR